MYYMSPSRIGRSRGGGPQPGPPTLARKVSRGAAVAVTPATGSERPVYTAMSANQKERISLKNIDTKNFPVRGKRVALIASLLRLVLILLLLVICLEKSRSTRYLVENLMLTINSPRFRDAPDVRGLLAGTPITP